MKKRVLILQLFLTGNLLFFNVSAQIIFRNQGAVYSSGGNNNQTSIYINGGIKFDNGNATPITGPHMTVQNSRVKLTGDFFNDVANGTSGGTLFISPASNPGVFEFCGTTTQSITTSKTGNTTIPSKLINFINFPNLEINNNTHVNINARMAAKAQNVTLTKGWLILDSDIAATNVDGGTEVNPEQESVLAHLLVAGSINYNESQWLEKAPNDRGFIQVNLKIPGEGDRSQKSIVGIGIPFTQMYSDYFMFNTLLEPQSGYTNGDGFLANPPITDPTTSLTAGKGYVVGIDLRGTDPANYPTQSEYENIIKFDERVTGNIGYRFNRSAFYSYAPNNQLFGADPSVEAYQMEKLNTGDIIVNLQAGYNYLSNPYTCPLNIDKLLGTDEAQSTWNIVSDALEARPQMRNQIWILNTNSVAELTANNISESRYTYNYQVAMRSGGTYLDHDGIAGQTTIAPLQMFLVRAYSTASTITIPQSERVMGSPRFLRSSPQDNVRRDDFIIEFRNLSTHTSDRASIVLRTKEELSDYDNVERLGDTSGKGNNGFRSSTVSGDFVQNLSSQIYTKDASGLPLTVQFFPIETTQRITLYHIPSSQPQPLQIRGLRIETKDKVSGIWLEDRKYNTEVEITPDMLYETYSEPTDSHDRFAIRFSNEVTPIKEPDNTSNVYAYTESGNIYASGFNQQDTDCRIELYDISGKLLANKEQDNARVLLLENYSPGIYIVKVNTIGQRTFKLTAK